MSQSTKDANLITIETLNKTMKSGFLKFKSTKFTHFPLQVQAEQIYTRMILRLVKQKKKNHQLFMCTKIHVKCRVL